MKLYVASSWRNTKHPEVVKALLDAGHEVYDFRNPAQGNAGLYAWELIDPEWRNWTKEQFREIVQYHPKCKEAFALDSAGMKWADACVLVLPCNRSAHLEAGWFVGQGKPLFILLDGGEIELTYRMATKLCITTNELLAVLKQREPLASTAPQPTNQPTEPNRTV